MVANGRCPSMQFCTKYNPSVTVGAGYMRKTRVQRNALTSDRAKEMIIHLLMSRNMALHEVF